MATPGAMAVTAAAVTESENCRLRGRVTAVTESEELPLCGRVMKGRGVN